jgi:hypothetical protein
MSCRPQHQQEELLADSRVKAVLDNLATDKSHVQWTQRVEALLIGMPINYRWCSAGRARFTSTHLSITAAFLTLALSSWSTY